jgi:hypothetical protein
MSAALIAPAIGQVWPGQGGIYMGVSRGRDGRPDCHLILALAKPKKRLAWAVACTWAKKVKADGHADFSLPDRHESRLLWANSVVDEIEIGWHWTSTQSSADDAWGQYFYNGTQHSLVKSYEGLARAVRRLPISPSVLSTKVAEVSA